jgi:hypothetical protein
MTRRSRLAGVATLAAVAVATAIAPAQAAASRPVVVVAGGLEDPPGLEFGPDDQTSTPDACGRVPSSPIPLRTDVDGLSWEPLLDVLPVVTSPSAEEQAYLTAIDEVHGHVRLDGSRIGMAMIMYSICELDSEALGSRLAVIGADLDQAAAVLAGLPVPDRLGAVHRNYLQVVRLYQQGVAEMDRTTQDDNPEHLREAFPFTKTASDELATLESLVWPPPPPEVGQPTGPGLLVPSGAE